MNPVVQVTRPLPGVVSWNVFSPEHRVDLSCSAVSSPGNTLLFDPFHAVLERLGTDLSLPPTAVCLTSGNHFRIGVSLLEPLRIPVLVPPGSGLEESQGSRFDPDRFPIPGWRAFPLPGGGPGETAFFLADRSLMVFGDAVINLPGRRLELLPPKYCSNDETLRASILHLTATLSFEHALFAHGSALIGNAGQRIQEMVRQTVSP